MLGKLIKYEMKAFGRIMWPLYGALIAVSLIVGISLKITVPLSIHHTHGSIDFYSPMLNAVGVAAMIYGLLSVAICIIMAVLLITRFYKNLTGDEGYLMFSLPAETGTLIASKALSALFWIVISIAAYAASGLILGGFAIWAVPNHADFDVSMLTGVEKPGEVIFWIVLAVFMILSYIMRIYAAIAIGHEWQNHKIIGSVLAFIVIEIIADIILSVNFVFGYGESYVFYMAYAIISTAGFSLLTWFVLDRHLNLE